MNYWEATMEHQWGEGKKTEVVTLKISNIASNIDVEASMEII